MHPAPASRSRVCCRAASAPGGRRGRGAARRRGVLHHLARDREAALVARQVVAVGEGVRPLLRTHRVGLHREAVPRPVEREEVGRAVRVQAERRDGVRRCIDERRAPVVAEGRVRGPRPRFCRRGGGRRWRSPRRLPVRREPPRPRSPPRWRQPAPGGRSGPPWQSGSRRCGGRRRRGGALGAAVAALGAAVAAAAAGAYASSSSSSPQAATARVSSAIAAITAGIRYIRIASRISTSIGCLSEGETNVWPRRSTSEGRWSGRASTLLPTSTRFRAKWFHLPHSWPLDSNLARGGGDQLGAPSLSAREPRRMRVHKPHVRNRRACERGADRPKRSRFGCSEATQASEPATGSAKA